MASRIHVGQFTPNQQPPNSSCLPHCLGSCAPSPSTPGLPPSRPGKVFHRLPLMSKEVGEIRCAVSSFTVTSLLQRTPLSGNIFRSPPWTQLFATNKSTTNFSLNGTFYRCLILFRRVKFIPIDRKNLNFEWPQCIQGRDRVMCTDPDPYNSLQNYRYQGFTVDEHVVIIIAAR